MSVKDYGEPLTNDGSYGKIIDRDGRKSYYLENWRNIDDNEVVKEFIRRFNLLANIETDPVLMDSRTEKTIGLLRAIADGDEVAFRGNLDDLMEMTKASPNDEVEEWYEVRVEEDGAFFNLKGERYDNLVFAQRMVENQRILHPDEDARLFRITARATEVIE